MSNVYLVSLGCDKNRVDGEVMIGTLRNAGYDVVHDPANAAAIIVNTCGFIRDAVQESIDLVLELVEYKNQGNCQALIVVGCMAQRYRAEIEKEIPEADAIIGVGEYDNIANVVQHLIGAPKNPITHSSLSRIAARSDDIAPHIAYVKISEGCNNHCTYCTIPSIRGAYKSRKIEDILEETRQLTATGAKEIVLVAQDTALYGIDLYGKKNLPELLKQLAQNSNALWIRLMYAYPEHITQELIDTMANLPQVCKYIDMPIQHSEDEIISKMGRKGSKAALLELIKNLRAKIPGIVIRTTLIVGFPGETVETFKNMYRFVSSVKFDRLGVFPYSREDGTPAATMPKQVKENIKHARLGRIMALQQQIHFKKQELQIGKTLPVIVDSQPKTGEYIGRTQGDAYEVDGVVIFTSKEKLVQGNVVQVKILGSDQYDLRGQYELT